MSKNRKLKTNARATGVLKKDIKDKGLPSVPTHNSDAVPQDIAIEQELPVADHEYSTSPRSSIQKAMPEDTHNGTIRSPARRPPHAPEGVVTATDSNLSAESQDQNSNSLTGSIPVLLQSPLDPLETLKIDDNQNVATNAQNLEHIEQDTSSDGPRDERTILQRRQNLNAEKKLLSEKSGLRADGATAVRANSSDEEQKIRTGSSDPWTQSQSPSQAKIQTLDVMNHSVQSSVPYASAPENPMRGTTLPDRSNLPIIPPRSLERSSAARSEPVTSPPELLSASSPTVPHMAQASEANPFSSSSVFESKSPNALLLSDESTARHDAVLGPADSMPPQSEEPTTPRLMHKRDFSTNSTPARYRHTISKSLETSPNLAYLGASVTTFESDISKAFNLSPRHSIAPPPGSGVNLERSNTMSRLASKMLKHRKSVSGSALSPRGSPRNNSNAFDKPSETGENDNLRLELNFKNKKIAQLEESLRQVGDARTLERQLENRKSRLATLESQIVQTEAETTSYLHHRHRISDVTVPFSEWKANVVADVDASLRSAKDQLAHEIEGLIKQRNDLRIDNERLLSQRALALQEIAVLDKRHDSLVEINENMLRQIQLGMVANKDSPQTRSSHGLHKSPAMSPGKPNFTSQGVSRPDHESRGMNDAPSEAESVEGYYSQPVLHHDIEEEHGAMTGTAVAYLPEDIEENTPKKFNFTKKAKKAFRWGRANSGQENTIASYPSIGSNDLPTSTSSHSMSTSRSIDKLSTKSTGSGMFKRSWQSQNNLAGHLQGRSSSSAAYAHEKLFGNDLCAQAEAEGLAVPQIVVSCIAVIEARALQFEGLYRKSGGAGEMKNLTDAFEAANLTGDLVDFEHFNDISAITSVLKQYLRRLPVPLITFSAYEPFISTSAFPETEVRLRAVRDILRSLPAPHYQTLKVLFSHFSLVSQYSSRNLMTAKNLAVVLGPTVIWDQAGVKEISDMQEKNKSVQFLIENAARL